MVLSYPSSLGAGDNHAYPSARDKDKKVQDVETPKDVC